MSPANQHLGAPRQIELCHGGPPRTMMLNDILKHDQGTDYTPHFLVFTLPTGR